MKIKLGCVKERQSSDRAKGQRKCKRHRLHFRHQPSVRCPSIFTAIKRLQRCSDIFCTSGAHILPPGRRNVIVTEVIAGWSPVWHRKCVSRMEFPWDSERLDLSVISSVWGTFPSGWKEKTRLLFSSPQWVLYWTGGVRERRVTASPQLSLSNVGQNCDKVWPNRNRLTNALETACVLTPFRVWDMFQCISWAIKHTCLYIITLCIHHFYSFLWIFTAAFTVLLYDICGGGYDHVEYNTTNLEGLLPHKTYTLDSVTANTIR